jgi:ABC-type Fe3+/spermidine/putrescine transport system ATPase subunit
VKAIAGSEVTLDGPGFGQFRAPSIDGLKVGQKLTAAIRPEKLSLTASRPGGAFVEGTITASAYLGDRSHHHVFVKGRTTPISVASQNVDRSMNGSLDISKPVYVTWDPRSLILLRN